MGQIRTFTVSIGGYELYVSIGLSPSGYDGVVIDPARVNLDDPNCVDTLKKTLNFYTQVKRVHTMLYDYYHNNYFPQDSDWLDRMADDLDWLNTQKYFDYDAQDIERLDKLVLDYVRFTSEYVKAQEKQRAKAEGKPIPHKKKTAGYVYLIESSHGVYKIGLSRNPENRMATFGVKLPFPVEYCCLIQTDDMRGLEAQLHERYASKRVNGEWFNLDADDVAYIKSLATVQS